MTPSLVLFVAVPLNARIIVLLGLLVVLAWTQRTNRFVLFGTLAIILTFSAGITLERMPLWVTASLMMVAGWYAFIALGILLVRMFRHIRRGPNTRNYLG